MLRNILRLFLISNALRQQTSVLTTVLRVTRRARHNAAQLTLAVLRIPSVSTLQPLVPCQLQRRGALQPRDLVDPPYKQCSALLRLPAAAIQVPKLLPSALVGHTGLPLFLLGSLLDSF